MSDERPVWQLGTCAESPPWVQTHCYCVRSPIQHATPSHEDRLCCWCGEQRCFVLEKQPVVGHGPYRLAHVLAVQ